MHNKKSNILHKWTNQVRNYICKKGLKAQKPPRKTMYSGTLELNDPARIPKKETIVPPVQCLSKIENMLSVLNLTDIKNYGELYKFLKEAYETNQQNEQVSYFFSSLSIAVSGDRCKVKAKVLVWELIFFSSQLIYATEINTTDHISKNKRYDRVVSEYCKYLKDKSSMFTVKAIAHGDFINNKFMDPLYATANKSEYGIRTELDDLRIKVIPKSCYILDQSGNVIKKAYVECLK